MKHVTPPRLTRRRALGLLLAGAGGSILDACAIEPKWLDVTRREIPCPLLSPELDGLRVGILSDIHFHPEQDEALLNHAVDRLLAEQVDAITLPGDFIDHSIDTIEPMMRILSRLEAKHGVFASMGNHDGWQLAGPVLRRAFERSHIHLLINQHTQLRLRGETLAIAATDHVWGGNPDPARTLRGIARKTPIIALVHEPDFFDEMTKVRPIALQVSGHTHGGQCQVPICGYAPVRVAYGEKYLEGSYAQSDSRLFVSRGIGTTGLRVRFACRPEVAILTLRSENTAS